MQAPLLLLTFFLPDHLGRTVTVEEDGMYMTTGQIVQQTPKPSEHCLHREFTDRPHLVDLQGCTLYVVQKIAVEN